MPARYMPGRGFATDHSSEGASKRDRRVAEASSPATCSKNTRRCISQPTTACPRPAHRLTAIFEDFNSRGSRISRSPMGPARSRYISSNPRPGASAGWMVLTSS